MYADRSDSAHSSQQSFAIPASDSLSILAPSTARSRQTLPSRCGKDCRLPSACFGPSRNVMHKRLIMSRLQRLGTSHLSQHSGEARARLQACEFHQQLRPPAWPRSHRHSPCRSATALWSFSERYPGKPFPDLQSPDLRQRKTLRMVRRANRRASRLRHKLPRSKAQRTSP